MPQRSTEFQKLVYLVRKHLSAAGSIVNESQYLLDSKGRKREVDVCIESTVDGIPVIVSIECTEGKAKSTVEWVERMKGKHDDLPTNVLILYSRSGFTDWAKEKAETFRIRIVTLETLDEGSAERLLNGANSLFCKSSAQTPTEVIVDLAAFGDLPTLKLTFPMEVFSRVAIFNRSGQELSTGGTLVNHLLRSPKALAEFLRIAEDRHKNFNFRTTSVTEGAGNPIYLRQEGQASPALRLIESLTISGDVKIQTSPVPLKHGKLEDTTVAWGTVPYEGKQALLVASQDKTGSTKASFDIGERTVQLQRPPRVTGNYGS
jgi:hypothetical protein